MKLSWESFERATKFFAGMVWATWEIMVRENPDPTRLVFIATVLSLSEGVRAVVKSREGKADE